MNIEIKKSIKPVNYKDAIEYLENRLIDININNKNTDKDTLVQLTGTSTALVNNLGGG